MGDWHVVYEAMQLEEDGPTMLTTIYSETLAVVCQRWKPVDVAAEVLEANSDDLTYQLSVV